jgi:hypothetical protein
MDEIISSEEEAIHFAKPQFLHLVLSLDEQPTEGLRVSEKNLEALQK